MTARLFIKILVLTACVVVCVGGCQGHEAADSSAMETELESGAHAVSGEAAPFPTNAWPTAVPEDHGLDSSMLDELARELGEGRHGNVDSMLVVRNGWLLHDSRFDVDYEEASAGFDRSEHQYNYYHPDWHPFFKGQDVHTMQSVTKSWTSALIGIAIGRGEIESVDVPGLSFFSDQEFDDPDGRKAAMTLQDLLTMRAGFAWDESTVAYTDPRNDCAALEASKNWIQFVLDKPVAYDPGTHFTYNSGVSVLLSGILQKVSGQDPAKYAEEHLFGPLGIEDYSWKRTPLGLPDTEGGLYLKSEDLAKLGLLFLRDGIWDGTRLLPGDWVASSTAAWVEDIVPSNERRDSGYGYQWWIPRDGRDGEVKVFSGRGYGGQYLLAAPELDLIVVFTGWDIFGDSPQTDELFFDRILPMVARPGPGWRNLDPDRGG